MELNFKQYGQGEPLIILHGLFGMLDNWQTLAKKLAEHYMVYVVDQRNHGKSPHRPTIDYPSMAEDLAAFMEGQWMHRAAVVGHSMGGKVAMKFALEYPDMVDKLVVVDIAPKTYPGGHQTIFEALLELPLGEIQNRREAERHLARRIAEPGVRQFLLKNLRREKSGGYAFKMNLQAIHKHYPDILANIDGPPNPVDSLFVRGGRSNYVEAGDLPRIQTLFPNAELKTIPEAGHWVHAEKPKELLAELRGFLG